MREEENEEGYHYHWEPWKYNEKDEVFTAFLKYVDGDYSKGLFSADRVVLYLDGCRMKEGIGKYDVNRAAEISSGSMLQVALDIKERWGWSKHLRIYAPTDCKPFFIESDSGLYIVAPSVEV